MKVLVIGSGGREHAICWKLKSSRKLSALYCAPGNPGIASLAECPNIKVEDLEGLKNFALQNKIDFTIVGPEVPLSMGVVDVFEASGLKIFGPSKAAAQLEASKSFAKNIMVKAGVPTAEYKEFTELTELTNYLSSRTDTAIVLKADGLAAGKGVIVALNKADSLKGAEELFSDFKPEKVVVEEFLSGKEASYIIATDGQRILPMAAAHDYKRIYDNDAGPNTGGMGNVSPTPNLSKDQEDFVLDKVIKPTIKQLKAEGIDFKGFIYAGLMVNANGDIKVLEFNARLGDPETQVIMMRMQGDLLEALYALTTGSDLPNITWASDSAVCVVLASEGYPQSPVKGDEITGIHLAEQLNNTVVFHAGTSIKDKKLVTNGGRVLNVTALGRNLTEAIANTYKACDLIQFRGRQIRRDIGR